MMKNAKTPLRYLALGLLVVLFSACQDGSNAEQAETEKANDTNVAATEVEAQLTTAMAEDSSAMEKPSMSYSEARTVTAEVIEINQETRLVTLKGPEGGLVTFTASDEARNLPQVSAGDLVTVEYLHSVVIEVVGDEQLEAATAAVEGMARTEEGEMPGAAAIASQIDVYKVVEIDIATNSFKLEDANGEVNQYLARNPENLKRAKVGDSVVIAVTEAIALSVSKPAAE